MQMEEGSWAKRPREKLAIFAMFYESSYASTHPSSNKIEEFLGGIEVPLVRHEHR